MAVNKVIELMSESEKSWEDAVQKAVAKASKSVKGIRSVWIEDMSATVNGKGRLDTFRVTCRLAFEVKS
jgi:flavin-binding protein dodecin